MLTFPIASLHATSKSPNRSFKSIFQFLLTTPSSQPSGINPSKKGNIVFFSSHIIDVVERICDRISIIKKGHILCTKSVKEIEESGTTLEDFYLNAIKEDVKPTLKSEAKKDGKN